MESFVNKRVRPSQSCGVAPRHMDHRAWKQGRFDVLAVDCSTSSSMMFDARHRNSTSCGIFIAFRLTFYSQAGLRYHSLVLHLYGDRADVVTAHRCPCLGKQ